MGYVWIIASRYLRSKRRLNFITLVSFLAIGGVLVGVASLTIVLSVMNGFEDQVQQRIAGTTRRSSSTRTTSARSSWGCRRPAASASAWTGS